MGSKLRVTVWGEYVHERKNAVVAEIYPKGMHQCIADGLSEDKTLDVRTATLDQPNHGLTEAVLDSTDVLLWWGHAAHGEVTDAVADAVVRRTSTSGDNPSGLLIFPWLICSDQFSDGLYETRTDCESSLPGSMRYRY